MNQQLRRKFPILQEQPGKSPLIYLDNAATTQKPQEVIEAISNFYRTENANAHRGIYPLSETITATCGQIRQEVANFIHARSAHEIIFVRGATEGINLVATCYGGQVLRPGDEIIVSAMEHHANLVPWQWAAQRAGAQLKIISLTPTGELDLNHYRQLLNAKTKLVAITHASNVLGTINPVAEIIELAHHYEIPVLLDGAQAAGHLPINVQTLDCDFYTFSAHKMYGPTGIGVLYGKERHLEAMPPYQGGGGMIEQVTWDRTTFAPLPHKFEAGTLHLAGIVGLGATLKFLHAIGASTILEHEQTLGRYAQTRLAGLPGVKILGTAPDKLAIFSLILTRAHPHDVATILGTQGIAARAGHHCAMPLMDFYGIPGTTRISLGVYNTTEEIDILIRALQRIDEIF